MRGPGSRPSLLFQLVVPATSVFIITILSLIAVLFSDERAPLARWLNKNGNALLAAELVAIVGLAVLAMTFDRIQTRRLMQETGRRQAEQSEPVVVGGAEAAPETGDKQA